MQFYQKDIFLAIKKLIVVVVGLTHIKCNQKKGGFDMGQRIEVTYLVLIKKWYKKADKKKKNYITGFLRGFQIQSQVCDTAFKSKG
jgi:hypothetical protein